MTQYRITFNGLSYRVERKGWFWWTPMPWGMYAENFDTFKEAEEFKNRLAQREAARIPRRVVSE